MAKFELKLPKMGESVAEATITNWLKQIGDTIEADEAVLEIATDKVDSEVPSEVSGILIEQLFQKDDLVQVGQTIAIIEVPGDEVADSDIVKPEIVATLEKNIETVIEQKSVFTSPVVSDKFYSPLVKNIAKQENVSLAALDLIVGSGKDGRVTKEDILTYVAQRGSNNQNIENEAVIHNVVSKPIQQPIQNDAIQPAVVPPSVNGGDEIVEMDRMRKLISGYMVASVQTSAHVQSFIEVDVTNIVKWRDKNKASFEKREGEKLTFTPIFMEAVAKALKDFPGMNISVEGTFIIKKKNINLGMAAALPNGNLIVPVIKNADQLNLVGMAKAVNDLGNRAKMGKLKPDDTQGGTYTVTNVGTFGSVFGTPIINQPQVGILALGAIRKVPAVIETPEGDFIGIRQKMFLSHSYDHRVVDGALGGSFVKRVADYLEAFDINRTV
ncbi:diapophytoene dehydrogenase [Flavobacterium branchiophilum NBRC 15030 = ATCC 35035]|uniref:Dihydrolipoamide acetyltransferase component of pyruvate dehydrogenase complex n=1 Tax=Flavobacterium branchiophilum TaxID=55197 RepID=A0A543G6Q6_9FLAO|nr:dihydrolipoamide acetyltransferase family protein [Flavobacterium branchiophilum]OXA81231.1 diapophytoene dehydrogenase [Flavobacterium branchiophilum NBRC 15030 = ATCC 35035]TQM41766.1 2-oxoglutarate dehydrogenase E2 component (dihydrolipoamide succinyltransferase) [Flavobacterium branchiophilum]GEM56235.1 dihydrolipoamide acetyltransferase component of pyruvate dehydrogenase complex [Flavobacterium branchiophilum NBRC 15030 = ATCC 35035]